MYLTANVGFIENCFDLANGLPIQFRITQLGNQQMRPDLQEIDVTLGMIEKRSESIVLFRIEIGKIG